MNFFKKLFNKKPDFSVTVRMPFDINKVRYKEKYMAAIIDVIRQNDELDSFKIDDSFELEFGDTKAIHIIYFGAGDLNILMEPENDGWTATAVHITRMDGWREKLEEEGYKFLFNIPNVIYGEKDIPEENIVWSKKAAVMSKR